MTSHGRLITHNLLSRLPPQLVFGLFKDAKRSRAPARAVLFHAGEKGDGLYEIEQGLVKVTVESTEGHERIVALIGPGGIVGELAIIDGMPRSASVGVLQDCTYRFVSKEAFDKFAASHPEFYRELVLVLSARLRDADRALAAATFLSARGRLSRALLELADHIGGSSDSGRVVFRQKISNSDLAAMAGVSREIVSRVLADWRRCRLVTQSARYHCIHDIAALERELN